MALDQKTQLDQKSQGSQQQAGSWGQESDTPPDPKRWIALAVILTAAFMDMLDVTIVNVAVPSVREDLSAGYSAIQWITAGYQLAFALLLISGGRFGDIFGRKKVFMLGTAGFTLASLLSGISTSPGMLVGSRILQGVFAAIIVPQILSIIHVTFQGKERVKAFAMFGSISGFAAVAGLCFGGLLVQADVFGLGWRAIFLVNLPIGIGALLVGSRKINESRNPQALKPDFVGMGLATLGLLMLLFPLTQGREEGWPVWGWVSMGLAAPVLAAFVWHQHRKTARDDSPLMPVRLFKSRVFSAGLSVQIAFNVASGVWFLAWTLYLQVGLGWTPMHAGLTALPFCIGAFSGAASSMTVFVPRIGRGVLALGAGLIIVALGTYGLLADHYGRELHSWQMILPLLVFGFGFGLIASPIPRLVLTAVPWQDAGSASGLINTAQQLGAAIGTALASVAFFGILSNHAATSADTTMDQLRQRLTAAQVAPERLDPLIADFKACSVAAAVQKDPSEVPDACRALASEPKAAAAFAEAGQTATSDNFGTAFRVSLGAVMGLAAVAGLLGFLLPKKKKEEEQAKAAW